MTLRRFNMAWLACLTLLITGCVREAVPSFEEPGITLTVRCDNPLSTTKADGEKDGEQGFNENLIKSVDFLFYPGSDPSDDTDAIHHIRKELSEDPMQPGLWEATFNLVIKKDVIGLLFDENNKATVYALVNFERGFVGDLSGTSRAELDARRIVTDFAAAESGYTQPYFLMDGSTVITYDADATPNATGEIGLKRFASKLTVALSVADRVELKHQAPADPNQEQLPVEVWTPVPHTMRVYLVNGVKTTLIGGNDPDKEYFSYSEEAHQRAYVRDTGTPYLNTETEGGKTYYHSWPMYSYPVSWSAGMPDYPNIDYTRGLPAEPPYFKLEMDWRREAENGYSYDRRKYYYKIFLPTDKLERNNWYGLYLDVSILGSETDEGKAVLTPTCYLLDWQNKSFAINKFAVISKARYLSVDKTTWDINNVEKLSIPFMSSHNVTVVPGSVKATRPYFGTITTTQSVDSYHQNLHGWIRQKDDNSYYLDFNDQPAGKEKWEPSTWLTNTSTSIELNHPLVNNNTLNDFDYSVYTIEFDIVHTDLADNPESHTYQQYVRHITITQRPGIYIERLRNSDTEVRQRNPNATPPTLCGYPDGEEPWTDKPWGYVYVNGGRFIRHETSSHTGKEDNYYKLADSNKPEYQWQTVWYTGGSKDMFDIHVTVLPSSSSFVIGDPREDNVNNLDDPVGYKGLYEFVVGGKNSSAILHDVAILENFRSGITDYPEVSPGVYKRTGFNEADALYGESPRTLTWYYPTEKSDRTANMLAPSYRVSSKFNGTEFGTITKPYAEYRCAAYQEDGFPAGRWRLPTKAEVNFIAQLSAKGFIELLFNNNGVYWSANGAIKINGANVVDDKSTSAMLRCVYDSWYWDKVDGLEGDPRQPVRNKFVWGDRER